MIRNMSNKEVSSVKSDCTIITFNKCDKGIIPSIVLKFLQHTQMDVFDH